MSWESISGKANLGVCGCSKHQQYFYVELPAWRQLTFLEGSLEGLSAMERDLTEDLCFQTEACAKCCCSRSAGWRLGQNVPQVIPLVVKFSSQAGEGNDELKEGCLQVQVLKRYPVSQVKSIIGSSPIKARHEDAVGGQMRLILTCRHWRPSLQGLHKRQSR